MSDHDGIGDGDTAGPLGCVAAWAIPRATPGSCTVGPGHTWDTNEADENKPCD